MIVGRNELDVANEGIVVVGVGADTDVGKGDVALYNVNGADDGFVAKRFEAGGVEGETDAALCDEELNTLGCDEIDGIGEGSSTIYAGEVENVPVDASDEGIAVGGVVTGTVVGNGVTLYDRTLVAVGSSEVDGSEFESGTVVGKADVAVYDEELNTVDVILDDE